MPLSRRPRRTRILGVSGATTRYRSTRRGIKEHHWSVRCAGFPVEDGYIAGFDAVDGIPASFERCFYRAFVAVLDIALSAAAILSIISALTPKPCRWTIQLGSL
jgi:hypothetical protein